MSQLRLQLGLSVSAGAKAEDSRCIGIRLAHQTRRPTTGCSGRREASPLNRSIRWTSWRDDDAMHGSCNDGLAGARGWGGAGNEEVAEARRWTWPGFMVRHHDDQDASLEGLLLEVVRLDVQLGPRNRLGGRSRRGGEG